MRTVILARKGRIGLMLLLTLTGAIAFAQNANTGEIKGTVLDSG